MNSDQITHFGDHFYCGFIAYRENSFAVAECFFKKYEVKSYVIGMFSLLFLKIVR